MKVKLTSEEIDLLLFLLESYNPNPDKPTVKDKRLVEVAWEIEGRLIYIADNVAE